MGRKTESMPDLNQLLVNLDTLKRGTEGVWGHLVNTKDKFVLAHHRLRSDPRLSPKLFTQEDRYTEGRALITFQDQKEAISREEADWLYYSKLMSNKYKDGSDSDRKKPHFFLTREQMATHNVQRIIAKFTRDFGAVPPDHKRRPSQRMKVAGAEESRKQAPSMWRKQVNDYVLNCFGKIYSPHHTNRHLLEGSTPSLQTFKSAPVSPTPAATSNRILPNLQPFSPHPIRTSKRRETYEALNIKQEVKRVKKELVDQKLRLGYHQMRAMDSMKLKKVNKRSS